MIAVLEKVVLEYIKNNPELLERLIRTLLDRLVAELMERMQQPATKGV